MFCRECGNANLLPLASGLKAGFSQKGTKESYTRGIEVHSRGLSDEDVEDERPPASKSSSGGHMVAKTGRRVNTVSILLSLPLMQVLAHAFLLI